MKWLALDELLAESPFAPFYARVLPGLVAKAMKDGWHSVDGPKEDE